MLLETPDGPAERRLYSLSAESCSALADAVSVPEDEHFVLFLALDARRLSVDELYTLAQVLIRRGLSYVVATWVILKRSTATLGRKMLRLNEGTQGRGGAADGSGTPASKRRVLFLIRGSGAPS